MSAVPHPMHISSRLMAALRVDAAGTVHLHAEHRDEEGRIVYRWLVEGPDGQDLGEGLDVRSGVGADIDYRETMVTLLSFLSACAESGEEGENADLFPPAVAAWARENSDELSTWVCLLEEDPEDANADV